jgi:hypothetical protein
MAVSDIAGLGVENERSLPQVRAGFKQKMNEHSFSVASESDDSGLSQLYRWLSSRLMPTEINLVFTVCLGLEAQASVNRSHAF